MKKVITVIAFTMLLSCTSNDEIIDIETIPNLSKKLIEETSIDPNNKELRNWFKKYHYSENRIIMISAINNSRNYNTIDTTKFEYINNKIDKVITITWRDGACTTTEKVFT